jgi:hypothetical protein
MVTEDSRLAAAQAGALRPTIGERGASPALIVFILAMLVAGYTLTILVFYPGYITIDASYVYAASKDWRLGDWQSPAMSIAWWLVDPIAPGALSMLLLIATFYWLGFGLFALKAAARSAWLGIATPVAALAPPAFLFVGIIWRDVLFAATWLLAAALAFAAADRG